MIAKEAIHELVGFQPVAAAELVEHFRMTRSVAAVSRHLRELHREGRLARRWDGNMRFGRYLYFLPEAPAADVETARPVDAEPLSVDPRRVAADAAAWPS